MKNIVTFCQVLILKIKRAIDMKRILICIAILILCWNFVCAGEQNQPSEFPDIDSRILPQLKVTEYDKLNLNKNILYYMHRNPFIFIFKNVTFSLDTIKPIAEATDEQTKKLLKIHIDTFNKIRNNDTDFLNLYKTEIHKILHVNAMNFVNSFNEFLSKSPKHREKVTKRLIEEFVRGENQSLKAEVNRILQEQAEYNLSLTKDFYFIGINAGFGCTFGFLGNSSTTLDWHVGLRYAHFFSTNTPVKLGYITDFLFADRALADGYFPGQSYAGYFMFGLKYKSLYYGIGPFFSYTGYTVGRHIEQYRFDFGISTSIGFMFDWKVKFFVGISFKVNLLKAEREYVENALIPFLRKDKVMYASFAFETGIGF